ncbi:MAG: hypothetical protein EPN92_00035 [Chitinophagaceae bacterium]|nr:MAG: hypothetical protein EPN92_00035 [Chitinophagaceae bacterium]
MHTKEAYIKDSIAVAETIRDSLQRIYSETLDKLGTEKFNADSLNSNLEGILNERLTEISKLKNEITLILKRKDFNQADLEEAGGKIKNLQEMIEGLKARNNSLTDERKRLNNILDQMNGEVTSLQQNIQKVTTENKELVQKVNVASTFVASDMKLAVVDMHTAEKEIETNQAKKADKFIVSFVVQNNMVSYPSAELVLAIIDPEGKTILSDVWDSGGFETRTEGRKKFTRKMKFDYSKGEQKRLIFSLQPDNFEKGTYKLNIYHNGIKIGETTRVLS